MHGFIYDDFYSGMSLWKMGQLNIFTGNVNITEISVSPGPAGKVGCPSYSKALPLDGQHVWEIIGYAFDRGMH